MIISASYRTDIPAFYSEWFINRFRAGFCSVRNPYSRALNRVELACDGFVFWTKNIEPLMMHLPEIRERVPFMVTQTITGYPTELEGAVISADAAVSQMHRLAEAYGPRVGVWRYDPIIFTERMPAESHIDNFQRLATALRGATDEVIVSFATYYAKTTRNMAGVQWRDPAEAEKVALLVELRQIAAGAGMTLRVCSNPGQADAAGCESSRCVDSQRLSDVAGRSITAKIKGNRPGCGCMETRDIGAFDTCAHGCTYCYAVRDHASATTFSKQHDPESETLST